MRPKTTSRNDHTTIGIAFPPVRTRVLPAAGSVVVDVELSVDPDPDPANVVADPANVVDVDVVLVVLESPPTTVDVVVLDVLVLDD